MLSGGAFQHLPAVPSRFTPDRGFRSAVCRRQSYKHFFDLANDFLIFFHGGNAVGIKYGVLGRFKTSVPENKSHDARKCHVVRREHQRLRSTQTTHLPVLRSLWYSVRGQTRSRSQCHFLKPTTLVLWNPGLDSASFYIGTRTYEPCVPTIPTLFCGRKKLCAPSTSAVPA